MSHSGGFSPKYDWYMGEDEAHGAAISGSGSTSTLPMTDEEKEAAVKKPLGFTAELPKKKRRRKA